jgi:MoaA/NifB/PqqE/SkfB family radical SAM enzyme
MDMHKLHLHATTLCPNYCRHCSVDAGPTGQPLLQGADFKYLVDWSSEAGAKWLEISGGEPLTLGDALIELIAYARDAGLYVSLLSNGCMITEPVSQRLRSAGLERLGISLYGATPGTHDDFTQRPDSFSRTGMGIHAAAAAGLEVVVNVVVTPQNVNELPLLPSRFPDIDLYTLGSVVPSGRGATLADYAFSEDGYRHAIDHLERAFSGAPYLFLNSLSPTPSTDVDRYCVRPSVETTVTHDGHRIPCCLLPRRLQHPTGDVKRRNFHERTDDDLVSSWLEQGHKALREYLQYSTGSHNLCKTCITMLDAVTQRRHAIP